ncbi:peptidoglycan DD-metalloendopeptidase family protein, partial [Streptomyces scopuliridis]
MADMDIVGHAGVDVVPLTPNFHNRLRAAVLPSADRIGRDVGERMGDAISRHLVVTIPSAINQGGQAGQRAASRQGDDVGGAFARSIRRKLEAAFKAMPKLDIRLSDTGVDAELNRLRARMETLRNKTIGIDISTADAEREIIRIDAELKRLGASHADVDVRADTATARAALAAIRAEIAAVDDQDPRVTVAVDTSQATSALVALSVQMAVTAATPLGPIIAAGLGAVVSAAAVAAAGVGALALAAIPAIKGVTEVIQLKTAAEDASASATDRSASATKQAASSALQLVSAQAALASAHRNASQSIAQASRAVEDAERGVADAVQRAADQRKQAADGVRRAQDSLAEAHRGVERAQRSLSDANRSAVQAEQSLTQARADAEQQLKSLNDRLLDGILDQRDATLRVQEAQDELARIMADPRATDLQRERAQLSADQAVKRAKDQKTALEELRKSTAKQQKDGVDGSESVKAAQQRLVEAQQSVRDAMQGIADAQSTVAERSRDMTDAQQKAARAQVDAARTVSDAQRRVADATAASADAQVSAAESIASAERGVQSARLSGIGTTSKAISKTDEYRAALAKLTPSQRDLYNSIAGPTGLKAAYDAWQTSLQPQTLPLFTRAVDAAKASLPGLTPLVLAAADGVGILFDKASAQMKTPFWRGFKRDIVDNARPAIVGLGTVFGNILKGMAGVIDAFLPHMDGIASRSDSITARFAKWGTSLKGSPEFERFLQYAADNAPVVAEFIGKVLTAALDFSKAVAPLSNALFAVLGPLFDGISWLSTEMPGLVQTLWVLYAVNKAITVGMAAFGVAMGIYNTAVALAAMETWSWSAALAATGIVPLIMAIVVAVAALVAGIIWAYKNVDWFRATIDTAWNAIKVATGFLWDYVLKPVLDGIWTALQAVGNAALWLWENAISPAFSFIAGAAKFLATALIVLFLIPAMAATKALGAAGTWLWEKIISPVFGWIGAKATWLWQKAISPALSKSKQLLDVLGAAARLLWREYISPAFTWIADKASWLYEKGIKPPFEAIKKAVRLVSDAFAVARKAIKTSWDKVKEDVKGPIRTVIDVVYNGAIVPLWNKVAKITGADALKPFNPEGFYNGGIMSGYSPGRDDRIIAVGGGEAVMRPEWTRAIGAERINAWNAAARSGGVGAVQKAVSAGTPAFKDGGIVGWLKDKGNAVGNFFSGAVDFLDPSKVFGKATSFVKDQLKGIGSGDWGEEIAKIPVKMLGSLKDAALNLVGFGGGDGGGQWMKPVNAAYGTPFGKTGSMWSSGRHTGLDFPAAVGA